MTTALPTYTTSRDVTNVSYVNDARARLLIESGEYPYDENGRLLASSPLLLAIYGDTADHLLLDREPVSQTRMRHPRRRQPHSYISEAQFRNLYDAALFARQLHGPLNGELTISFHQDEQVAHTMFSRWLACLRDWHRERGLTPVYLYVWERSARGTFHIHMLLKVGSMPHGAHHAAFFRGWLAETLPKGTSYKLIVRQSPSMTSQMQWFKYVVKGVTPNLGCRNGERLERYHVAKCLGIRPSPQGQMTIKRVGVSHSIGASARRACSLFHGCPRPSVDTLSQFHFTD